MKRIALFAVVAAFAAVPMVAAAQDDLVNCQEWLEMESADQLAAIDVALAQAEDHGMGRRFDADATAEDKLDYMQVSCTDPDGSVMVDLVDMLGS